MRLTSRPVPSTASRDSGRFRATRRKPLIAFFESRRRAGHVPESVSAHSSPTLWVEKATGGWRIVHTFNKLNDATIPSQTPIPRKDMMLDTMSGSTQYSAIDMMDGFSQILMLQRRRAADHCQHAQ
ncbi:hypothetical protein PC123_g5996 [Phytophthora cactorum]|nr:hypothetical protein PC123_g5996 [Phytophthora cactorum]